MELPFADVSLVPAELLVRGVCGASYPPPLRLWRAWQARTPRLDTPALLPPVFSSFSAVGQSWIWEHASTNIRLGIRLCALCRRPFGDPWSPHW